MSKRSRAAVVVPINKDGTLRRTKVARRVAGSLTDQEIQLYRNIQSRPFTSYPNSMVPSASRGYRMNPHELKVADFAAVQGSVLTFSTAGTFQLLAAPIQGTGFDNRIGRKITNKSLYIKGYIQTEASQTNDLIDVPAQHGRMIVFVDFQPNGAAPATTDLLKTADSVSQLNLNNRDRFKILVDKEFVFDPYGFNTATNVSYLSCVNQIRYFKKYKRLNIETIFNGTNGGTVADITTGAIYVFFISNTALSAGLNVFATFTSRIRYSDD